MIMSSSSHRRGEVGVNVPQEKMKSALIKEYGAIDHLEFSKVNQNHLAVTSSVRVQIYNSKTLDVERTLNRFKTSAYGATFVSESNLVLAGSEDCFIRLFNSSSRSMLRVFKGHKAAVHRVGYLKNKPQIVSFSDDKTVRVWDIGTEKVLWTSPDDCFSDYVRAGAVSNLSDDIIIAGSYDKSIKLFDTRTNEVNLTFDHGYPVEDVLCHPLGSLIISAGGPLIKIWDISNGGKLLESISEHHKTVTCLKFTSDAKYLISGSLDKKLILFETNFYKPVRHFSYPNAILSCAISANSDTLAVGMIDGIVSIANNKSDSDETKEDVHNKKVSFRLMAHLQPKYVDLAVNEDKHAWESRFSKHLRKFQYRKALDEVITLYRHQKHPEQTLFIIVELIRRQAFDKALKNRDDKFIENLLKFLLRYYYYSDRYQKVLLHVVKQFLLMYHSKLTGLSLEASRLIVKLSECYQREYIMHTKSRQLIGMIDMIMTDV